MNGADSAVPADDVHARNCADAIGLGDSLARVEQQVHLPACRLRVLAQALERRRVVIPEIDGEDGDLVLAEVFLELLQVWQFVAARSAPGGPERDDRDLAMLGRKPDSLAVDVVACSE